MPKRYILVSSDHNTFSQAFFEAFRCQLINFRWACSCAFLSRGTFLVLHDLNLLQHTVLPMVFLVVPTMFRWLTCSSHVVLGRSTPFLMILTPILHRTPDGGRFIVILHFIQFPKNCTNSCHVLTKLRADGLVSSLAALRPCLSCPLTGLWSCPWWWRVWIFC